MSYQINWTCHWNKVFDACVVMNTATLINIYFWDVRDIILTLKRLETFETFIGIVKSNQEKIKTKKKQLKKKILFLKIFFNFFSKFHDF